MYNNTLPYKILLGPNIFITALSTSERLGKVKKAKVKAKAEVTRTKLEFDSCNLRVEKICVGLTISEDTEFPITIMVMMAEPPIRLVMAMMGP